MCELDCKIRREAKTNGHASRSGEIRTQANFIRLAVNSFERVHSLANPNQFTLSRTQTANSHRNEPRISIYRYSHLLLILNVFGLIEFCKNNNKHKIQ